MAANLSQNELVLQEAYMGVVTDKFPTDWALFNHEGNSNDIHVAGTGEGCKLCAEGSVHQACHHYGQLSEGGLCDYQRKDQGTHGA
uniref:Uncharacterized protein n=2 Tax=Ursus TaxID=9639 RepID=A0A452VMW2_URSMA